MPDRTQLPYLIKLLEDESPVVHASVLKELESFGDSLERELMLPELGIRPDDLTKIRESLRESGRRRLLEEWPEMRLIENEKERLEKAHKLLSRYIEGKTGGESLSLLLNQLGEEFRGSPLSLDARSLAVFLFKQMGLSGVESIDYTDPRNSSLTHVLKSKRGLPISLCSIFILIGYRLGLPIEGCNFPGHFMVTAIEEQHKVIIDCYHGGAILDESVLGSLSLGTQVTMADLIQLECSTDDIIMRILRNLVNAYNHSNDMGSADVMSVLLGKMEKPD